MSVHTDCGRVGAKQLVWGFHVKIFVQRIGQYFLGLFKHCILCSGEIVNSVYFCNFAVLTA